MEEFMLLVQIQYEIIVKSFKRGQLGLGNTNQQRIPVLLTGEVYGIIKISSTFDFTTLVRLESTCYGKPSSDLSICSGNGICVNGICSCMINYSGNECEFTTCFGKNSSDPKVCSGNGKCNEKDICTCNSGFGGQTCEFNYDQNPNTVVYAFGAGYRGQLGDGAFGQRTTPYPLSIKGVKEIFLGQEHTLMIKEDGKSYSTGKNDVRRDL
jgi:hypothetical protein